MILDEGIIEKFLSQKCVGYSNDLRYSYYDEVVQCRGGEVKSRRVKYRMNEAIPYDATGETPAIVNPPTPEKEATS